MGLIEDIPLAQAALADARSSEAHRIVTALDAHNVVGILGEAEVGKTVTVKQALQSLGQPLFRLDLDMAASDGHIGFLLVKEIAKATVPASDFSLLSGGVLLPSSAERAQVQLGELLGIDGLDEALRQWPSGHFTSAQAFQLVEDISKQQSVVLWVDHLETPSLTPRHPVDTDRLLWGIREIAQRRPRLRVVLSGREALESRLLGPKAAFHQQGQWLSLDNPPAEVWREVAQRMEVSVTLAEELSGLVDGHSATMLHALLLIASQSKLPHSYAVLQELAAGDDGLAARAIQHARTLHRLGGQVMTQIAFGEHSYGVAERGRSAPQEIRKVRDRLRLAGLVRRKPSWAIVNPLLRIRLRGSVRTLAALGWQTAV
jgi:hypothetical protein